MLFLLEYAVLSTGVCVAYEMETSLGYFILNLSIQKPTKLVTYTQQ